MYIHIFSLCVYRIKLREAPMLNQLALSRAALLGLPAQMIANGMNDPILHIAPHEEESCTRRRYKANAPHYSPWSLFPKRLVYIYQQRTNEEHHPRDQTKDEHANKPSVFDFVQTVRPCSGSCAATSDIAAVSFDGGSKCIFLCQFSFEHHFPPVLMLVERLSPLRYAFLVCVSIQGF
mmetsp:Transcript_3076/g.4356  ORF Transcript_3076/g.4356 Transcript_3076/m.4356 type:complete len:178 (+) Transcript_3076:212-745(+)